MSEQEDTIRIDVLGREYKISCPDNQKQELIEATQFLNDKLNSVQEQAPNIDFDKMLVMAALNMAFDLQQFTNQGSNEMQTHHFGQIKRLSSRVDEALNELLQLEF